MKKIIFILTFAIFVMLPVYAVKKIDANPINVAYMLAQDIDSASMAKTCEYYGYSRQQSDDGYAVYAHPNGSIIRYAFKDEDNNQPYPYVEVKSKSGVSSADANLKNLGFKKNGPLYELTRGKLTRTKFTCKSSSNGYLMFHKSQSPQLIIHH